MPIESKHPQYHQFISKWEDCRTFFEGEDAVKKAKSKYLPQPAAASKEEYESYVSRAFFYGVIEQTVNGMTGAVFRKSPTPKFTPRIEYLNDNADAESNSLAQFSKLCLDEALVVGRCGVLVDRPKDGGDPYLVLFTAENIINWRHDDDKGLTLVVLKEIFYREKIDDPYEHEEFIRYRELYLDEAGNYQQRVYESKEDDTPVLVEDLSPVRAGVPLKEIPFVFINVRSITPHIDKPPLLELVRKNNEHYRVSADYANALYHAGQPILCARGVSPDEIADLRIGTSYAFLLPSPESSLSYVEVSGGGINPNKQRCDDIKLEMAVLGARLLEGQRTGVEAAETAALRQNAEMSRLMSIVLSVGAGITKALTFVDMWQGGSGDEIEYKLNTDFSNVIINPSLLTALASLVEKEFISWDTFFYNLAIGEVTPPNRTAEEERNLIETQPPMSPMQAASQQMALAQMAAAAEQPVTT